MDPTEIHPSHCAILTCTNLHCFQYPWIIIDKILSSSLIYVVFRLLKFEWSPVFATNRVSILFVGGSRLLDHHGWYHVKYRTEKLLPRNFCIQLLVIKVQHGCSGKMYFPFYIASIFFERLQQGVFLSVNYWNWCSKLRYFFFLCFLRAKFWFLYQQCSDLVIIKRRIMVKCSALYLHILRIYMAQIFISVVDF